MLGSVTIWMSSVSPASTAAIRKTARQPMRSPRKLPTGAAKMVAAETPEKMIDSARGTSEAGTRRMASAADIAQKPPSAAPSSTRPSSSEKKSGAKATMRFDITSSVVKASSTSRRSMRRVTAETSRLATSATVAVAVTA